MIDATRATAAAEDGHSGAGEAWPSRRADEPTLRLRRGLVGRRHDLGPIGAERSRHTAYRTASRRVGGSPGCAGPPVSVGLPAGSVSSTACGMRGARSMVVRRGDRLVDHLEVVELAGGHQTPATPATRWPGCTP